MRLDEVVTGRAGFREVIDAIAVEAERLIGALCHDRTTDATIDLASLARANGRGRRAGGRGRNGTAAKRGPSRADGAGSRKKPASREANNSGGVTVARSPGTPDASVTPRSVLRPPSERMLAYARHLALKTGAALPPDLDQGFNICRDFLDKQAPSARRGAP